MQYLKFEAGTTLDDVFRQHQDLIYEKVIASIENVYKDSSIENINVITIEIGNYEYAINLSRNKFASCLENALDFYQEAERYEECKVCFDMITELEVKNMGA